MNNFISYSIEVIACCGIFYAFYYLILKNDTHFQINRFYLLATLLLSFLLPALEVPFNPFTVETAGNGGYTVFFDTVQTSTNITLEQETASLYSGIGLTHILVIIYLTGVCFFMYKLVRNILLIRNHSKALEKRQTGRYTYVSNKRFTVPFSFMNYIFISPGTDKGAEHEPLIQHETVHAQQLHSFDLILIEILFVFQWFNPFLLLYRKSLVEQHEYIADEMVTRQNKDKTGYMKLLANITFQNQKIRLSCHFNQSLTKKRLRMMTKIKSKKYTVLKYVLVIPVFAGLFYMFSCTDEQTENDINGTKSVIADGEGCPQEFVDTVKANIGKANVLRVFNTNIPEPGENDSATIVEYTVVMNKGYHYRIRAASPDGTTILKLFGPERLIANTYNEKVDKNYEQFDFVCRKTTEYKITLQMKDGIKGRACAILGFVGKSAGKNDGSMDEYSGSLILKGVKYLDKNSIVPETYQTTDQLVAELNKHPNLLVKIICHTDNSGSTGSNRKLSRQRAEKIREYIISRGIDAERLVSQGAGEEFPIADNSTEEGRATNRRVEIRFKNTDQ